MRSSTELDTAVRLFVYERFLDDGSPPSYVATAAGLGITPGKAAAAYERLAEQRVLVLAPGTLDVWMAHPFSAYPTAFSVDTPRQSYWGNCIWDAFGVIAMTGGSGVVSTTCQDCGDSMRLEVEGFELAPAEGVAHFAVPARDWWKNIGYT